MISIKLHIQPVVDLLKSKIGQLSDKEYLLRPVAFDEIELMTRRIHKEGIASDGSPIGNYSAEYMKVRTRNFTNSGRISRGPNKGKVKDAGVISRGLNKGEARPKYNRDGSTTVIISLTRQLENDWSVIATTRGYGIGFLNSHNFDKSQWVEATYKRKIFAMTDSEKQFAIDKIIQLSSAALK
jgi:hypothetical protein